MIINVSIIEQLESTLSIYPDLQARLASVTFDILFILWRCTVSSGTDSAILLVIEIKLWLLPNIFKFIISPILPPMNPSRRTLKYSTPNLRFSRIFNASSTSEKLERRRDFRAPCTTADAGVSVVASSSMEGESVVAAVRGRRIIDDRDGNSASLSGTNHSIFHTFLYSLLSWWADFKANEEWVNFDLTDTKDSSEMNNKSLSLDQPWYSLKSLEKEHSSLVKAITKCYNSRKRFLSQNSSGQCHRWCFKTISPNALYNISSDSNILGKSTRKCFFLWRITKQFGETLRTRMFFKIHRKAANI